MSRHPASGFLDRLLAPLMRKFQDKTPTGVEQKRLSALYRQLHQADGPPLLLKDVGFRVHSQHEEDGILLFIFSLIGTTSKRCVEICAGDGMTCNTANLIINHRWLGLLCDGEEANTKKAKRFYEKHPDTRYWPPAIVHEWGSPRKT